MYFQLADKQVVAQGTPQFSQAVSMNGANQVLVDLELVNLAGSVDKALRFTLEEGNDLENWSEVFTSSDITATSGYETEQTVSGLSAQYVRLKLIVNGQAGDIAIVAAGVDTADL